VAQSKPKSKVAETREEIEVRALLRNERLAAWSDYIGFVTAKVTGAAGLIGGTVALLDPGVLNVPHAPQVAAIGAAILGGKGLVSVVKRLIKAIDEQ